MVAQRSANMNSVSNKAIVEQSWPEGPATVVDRGYEPKHEAMWHDELVPWHCRVAREDGATFEVVGHLRTRSFVSSERTWRDPYVFEQEYLMLPIRSAADYTRVGLGMINRAIEAYWRNLEKLDETMFAQAGGVPRPGRAGHDEKYYALWVRRYLDAVEQHGQRYMAHLLAEHPGYTANVIRRTISEAETTKHRLITNRPGRGKAGGTMTEKCKRILAESTNEGATK